VLGRLSGLYGVRGWFRVFSYTEPRAALLDYDEWLLEAGGGWQAAALIEGRQQGRTIVARLEGIEDRDVAASFVGADIAVPRERLPRPEPGQYYWADLAGLEVRHRDGHALGTLDHMLATGVHDVMVVRPAAAGSKEILIPFVMDRFVLGVDLAAGRIDVDWEWD
jgi:16S rRNA processing protein RimM